MADILLKFANLLRERWLRHVQPFGGAAEMQLLSDRNEVTKMAKLEQLTHIQRISIH